MVTPLSQTSESCTCCSHPFSQTSNIFVFAIVTPAPPPKKKHLSCTSGGSSFHKPANLCLSILIMSRNLRLLDRNYLINYLHSKHGYPCWLSKVGEGRIQFSLASTAAIHCTHTLGTHCGHTLGAYCRRPQWRYNTSILAHAPYCHILPASQHCLHPRTPHTSHAILLPPLHSPHFSS